MSVGILIRNIEGAFALLQRARFPVGIAPPAGHIDEHGSPEQAAIDEVNEEVGLLITLGGLKRTVIAGRTVNNPCRRVGGHYHQWWVFETNTYAGEINPDANETRGAAWYEPSHLQELADRTRAFQAGHIGKTEWQSVPGLEETWVGFLAELGHIK